MHLSTNGCQKKAFKYSNGSSPLLLQRSATFQLRQNSSENGVSIMCIFHRGVLIVIERAHYHQTLNVVKMLVFPQAPSPTITNLNLLTSDFDFGDPLTLPFWLFALIIYSFGTFWWGKDYKDKNFFHLLIRVSSKKNWWCCNSATGTYRI